MPAWFSLITVPNQKKNSVEQQRHARAPAPMARRSVRSSVSAAPAISMNSVTEPKNGHGLPCGT